METETEHTSEAIDVISPEDLVTYEPGESGTGGADSLMSRAIRAGISVLIALISLFAIAPKASNVQTYEHQISVLDAKKANVMGLTAAATAASAAISLLPDDAGSAIANKLVDLSSYLIVILSVIYLEKFLLTLLGGIGFGVLVPVGLIVMALLQLVGDRLRMRHAGMQLAVRALVFGLAISLVVPASVWVTDRIDEAYAQSINAQLESATSGPDTSEEAAPAEEEQQKSGNIFTNIGNFLHDGVEAISTAAQDSLNSLTSKLNELVDSVAVMIVTSCLIPILVLVAFFWLAHVICGISTPAVGDVFGAASQVGRKTRKGFRSTVKRAAKGAGGR